MKKGRKKKALIMWAGNVDFHTPKAISEMLADGLEEAGCSVRVENSFEPLEDAKALRKLDLIVPQWTMGELKGEQWGNLNAAVREGVGVGGVHGGTGDAFRDNLGYQWMIGGQFVGHPLCGDYWVRLTSKGAKNPITRKMKPRFKYNSEQYYMIVDPAIDVLADTIYPSPGGKKVVLPAVWTKMWGKGRVFYSALGHAADEYPKYPDVLAMALRGLLWAADGKKGK